MMLVYIVSARGPYPEKAAGQKFYLDKDEAEEKALELTVDLAPAEFSAYPMEMLSHGEENAEVEELRAEVEKLRADLQEWHDTGYGF